jgi:hypothetical protein
MHRKTLIGEITMKEVPRWIIGVIEEEKLACRLCGKEFGEEDLLSLGIQESSKPPHDDALCVGMFCPTCKELIIFEIKQQMGLVEFAFEILDQETTNKVKKKKMSPRKTLKKGESSKRKRRPTSKITKKEIDEIKEFLKPEDLLHEEMLIAMGMLPSEIKKYSYKKPRPEK